MHHPREARADLTVPIPSFITVPSLAALRTLRALATGAPGRPGPK
jgi:hypothetical protein